MATLRLELRNASAGLEANEIARGEPAGDVLQYSPEFNEKGCFECLDDA